MSELKNLLVEGLQDLLNAESQIVAASTQRYPTITANFLASLAWYHYRLRPKYLPQGEEAEREAGADSECILPVHAALREPRRISFGNGL